ncbi:MAG: hypothetical protein ACD_44C00242G0011 [uncultured bacterium]|nr:MAG: hypothetical protein ACD_44C00242G0011 [uncultured bacterium]OGT67696.1 MAG: dimethylmenaquinone methyltransferase [Gammaproteobacteria bacterium RIFCSPLOWO2_02_FULL_38_11]OGT77259.1 MAG: dimethylmenaquinone methyltransferase [Gammaproteobacteria bacterium RIFCSPLOWO2_12_FULL_38_14]
MLDLPTTLVKTLQHLFSENDFLMDPADRWVYGYDNSRRHSMPSAVVFIRAHEQLVELVKLANHYRIPLTAHGRGTATTGATVPIAAGIVVSFEKMNRILDFSPADRFIIVEAGISNQQLQETIHPENLFWAPDPSSAAFSSIGGNLACNAGGPRAIKYGTCRENTLGLRLVTGSGDSFHTGARTTKSVVGYDFTRLIIGSQGTLAFITEATLKLLPLPEAEATLHATFSSIETATDAIIQILQQPHTPSALEFMDHTALTLIRRYAPELLQNPHAQALLLIEFDGTENTIEHAIDYLKRACHGRGLLEITLAKTNEQRKHLWKARKALSPLLRHLGNQKINEDIVVPVSHLPLFIKRAELLAQKHKLTIVNFGHAGNGNIHVNLLFDSNEDEIARAQTCLKEIFDLVIELKGSLSGEHGIGLDKLPFIENEIESPALKLISQIKTCFDPHGILNPGK